MFHDPIKQRFLKADVRSGLFALDPLVLQNLFAFGEELFVENGVLHEGGLLFFRSSHVVTLFHKAEPWSMNSAGAEIDGASAVPIQPALMGFVSSRASGAD